MTDRLITADASKVSPAEFFRGVFGPSPAERLAELEALNLSDADLRAAIKTADGQLLNDLCALLGKRIFCKDTALTECVGDPLRRVA